MVFEGGGEEKMEEVGQMRKRVRKKKNASRSGSSGSGKKKEKTRIFSVHFAPNASTESSPNCPKGDAPGNQRGLSEAAALARTERRCN